ATKRQQKSKRTKTQSSTSLEDDDSDRNTEEDVRPLLSAKNENERLKVELGLAIFGPHQLLHERRAVEYLVSAMLSPAPTPKAAEYLTYLKTVYPQAPPNGVARTWSTLKQYFGDAETDHSTIEGLVDVKSLVQAFKEASDITTSDWATETAKSSAPLTQEPASAMHPPPMVVPRAATSPSTRSAGVPSSLSPSNSNGTSSGTSSTKITPGQALAMRKLFDKNFQDFGGDSWSLSSGAVVDDLLHSVIKDLSYESALHSFVIENVDTVLRLFEDEKDQDEIESTLITGRSEGLPALTPAELAFLQLYNLPPADLDNFLSTRGWSSVGDALAEKPSVEFQSVAHDCVTHLLRTYQQNGMTFPCQPSEAWFNHMLWGFLPRALSLHLVLEYKPGEVTSEASAQRRRKQQVSGNRQTTGHKVDGLVVFSDLSLEICYMEAAKNDGGANTTKCLHDTKKLMKLMKDGHDLIREKAEQNIRSRLATFSIRISGPTVTIFSLHQCPGRFYQSVEEYTKSLPRVWKAHGTTTVLAIIARILRLRKALMTMAASVSTWTQAPIDDESVGEKDWVATTMTSPQLLPSTFATLVGAVPPLDL
ncbi:hypothetical protein DFQ26_000665, partial [Actinomortierella ambigua]